MYEVKDSNLITLDAQKEEKVNNIINLFIFINPCTLPIFKHKCE